MIRHWVVLDLDVFRQYENDSGVRRETQDNGDGTHFIAYDIRSFPSELIVAMSPTMALAIENGVNAVERLRPKYLTDLDERWRQQYEADPAPELQELIRRFNGYSSIPASAWAEFDEQMAAWRARRRFA